MEDLTKTRHPLVRGGTSRTRRALAAASPATAPLDGRTEAELIEYVFQMARMVIYHDHQTFRKGDWQDFFRFALPFQLSLIGRFDVASLRADFEAADKAFDNGLEKGRVEPLFNRLFDLVRLLDRWHAQLPDRSGLKNRLFSLIDEDLRFSLELLSTLSKDMEKAAIGFSEPPDWRLAFAADPWQLSPQPGPAGAFGGLRGTTAARKQAARQQLGELFRVFQQGLERVVSTSPQFLTESLEKFSDNLPQVGLMLTFFRLFRHAQDDLNALTERQLKFYYHDVLGLKEKPAVPDTAHLLLQLDKGVTKHLVGGGTMFKDGKDANKADIFFALAEQVVLNQATVESLRTFHRFKESGGAVALRAALKADSADGIEKLFDEPEKATWKTLGGGLAPNKKPFADARVGFVIASPTLLLNEANGTATATFTFTGGYNGIWPTGGLEVFYSSKKGWEKAAALDLATAGTIKITLGAGDPPLTFADPAVLKEDFGTTDPMLKILLTKGDEALEAAQITAINLSVTANKVKNLLVSNDDGPVDPNKPFMPFGAVPHKGSTMFVGCEEAFRKKTLGGFQVFAVWENLPTSFATKYAAYPASYQNQGDYEFDFQFLNDGNWGTPTANNDLFPGGTTVPILSQSPVHTPLTEPLLPYSNNSKNGFLRMGLEQDFGHALFPKLLSDYLINNASGKILPSTQSQINNAIDAQKLNIFDSVAFSNDTDKTTANNKFDAAKNTIAGLSIFTPLKPEEPYTPLLRELFVSYTATSNWEEGSLTAKTTDIQFIHLHPFEPSNHEKVEAFDQNDPLIATDNTARLLPDLAAEGHLYIGVKNALPGATLSLLFQLAEATADPDIDAADLKWKYLKGNKWQPLLPKFQLLDDATDGLIASGIVRFSMPFEWSSAGTTILPPGLFWLKVEAAEHTAAVSDAILVQAGAVKTAFSPTAENDLARLSGPLAAASVNRLDVKDAAVKKVEQPFESFGGQPPEDPTQFYRRAGERLRHKGRAIALYDYERLVLEAFPEIFQAKCLTHTDALPSGSDHHIAPGHVALAVIPDMTRFGFEARLQPKASRALLHRIEAFLQVRRSPFIHFKAVNPIYEPVRVTATVVFREGFDQDLYKEKLADDLLAFLAPWAFGEQERLAFGGKLFRSEVLLFVEKREYVDFVTAFGLFKPLSPTPDENLAVAEVSQARSILVLPRPEEGDIESLTHKEAAELLTPLSEENKYGAGSVGFLNFETGDCSVNEPNCDEPAKQPDATPENGSTIN